MSKALDSGMRMRCALFWGPRNLSKSESDKIDSSRPELSKSMKIKARSSWTQLLRHSILISEKFMESRSAFVLIQFLEFKLYGGNEGNMWKECDNNCLLKQIPRIPVNISWSSNKWGNPGCKAFSPMMVQKFFDKFIIVCIDTKRLSVNLAIFL